MCSVDYQVCGLIPFLDIPHLFHFSIQIMIDLVLPAYRGNSMCTISNIVPAAISLHKTVNYKCRSSVKC